MSKEKNEIPSEGVNSLDDVLRIIGEFGPYQKTIVALLCLPCLVISGLLVMQVFLLGVPHHRCKIPGLDNDTFANQSEDHRELIDEWIPVSDSSKYPYDRCHIRVSNRINATKLQKCSEWVYDDSLYKNTFAKQLNMVCDDAIRIPNVQMIFFFGVLAGSFVYGQISDMVGRHKTLCLCLLMQLGSSVGLVFMTEYIGFCIFMFLVGASVLGTYMTSYVIGMEIVGPNKRIWAGNLGALLLTTGQLYLYLMVYLFRDWRYIALSVGVPTCLFLPFYCLIPESPRWLLSKGRKHEAAKILQKVAKSNKTDLNEHILDSLPPARKGGRVWQLFTSNKTMTIWSIVIYYNWSVCSMSYYGVVLNTGNLGGNLFVTFTLMTIVEYPGKIMDLLLMDRIGRKRFFVAYMLIGGLANIATIGPIIKGSDGDLHYVLIFLAMVGKLCIVGAFGTVYVHSAEIYPTVVRNVGMGSSSAVARIGSMIAPYIAKSADLITGDIGKVIPLTLFGLAMFTSGLLTICVLPETVRKKMPEVMEDIYNLKRAFRKPCSSQKPENGLDKRASQTIAMDKSDFTEINKAYLSDEPTLVSEKM